MGLIDSNYKFTKGTENLFNIDSYKDHNTYKAVEFDNANMAGLKNLNIRKTTDNFYGDGRLGITNIRQDTEVIPPSCYATLIKDHDLYGWCAYNVWDIRSDGPMPGDEVVLYVKHIFDDNSLDKLGSWEILTIKDVVEDSDGRHLVFEHEPDLQYDENVLVTITRVYQYQTLEIFDNYYMFIRSPTVWGYTFVPNVPELEHWEERGVSYSIGTLFIKALDNIIIGRGSRIGSLYGYNGAHGAYDLYYANRDSRWSGACGPTGTGRRRAEANIDSALVDPRGLLAFTKNLKDHRKNLYWCDSWPNATGGGPDKNGILHEDNTEYGRAVEKSTDLSDNILSGVGGSCFIFGVDTTSGGYGSDTYQANEYRGMCGGGITIIQTPTITFKDKFSSIWTTADSRSTRRVTNYGNGGSILLKAETIVYEEKPDSSEAIIIGNEYPEGSFRTSSFDLNISEYNVSVPGQVQIETDKIIYGDEILTFDDGTLDNSFIAKINADTAVFNYVAGINSDNELKTITGWEQYDYAHSHGHFAPIYENNAYYKLFTSGYNNIDISKWYQMFKFNTDKMSIPNSTKLLVAFSTDDGSSWFSLGVSDEGELSASTIDIDDQSSLATAIDIKTLLDIEDDSYLTQLFVLSQRTDDSKTIDICFIFQTDKDYLTPKLTDFLIEYVPIPQISSPIPIRPYNGEEFDNEDVNFVWLQPYSKYGSVQNRIQVSQTSTFESVYKELKADGPNTSSLNNKLVLPYQPKEYSDTDTGLKYYKLPYLKDRKDTTESISDINLASLSYNEDTKEVSLLGGDIVFKQGKQIELVSNTIELPSDTNFRFDYENDDLNSVVDGYVIFDGSNADKVNSNGNVQLFDNATIGNTIQYENVLTTYQISNSGARITYSGGADMNISKLGTASSFMIRGKVKSANTTATYLVSVSAADGTRIFEIYVMENQKNLDDKWLTLAYNNGYSNMYKTIPAIGYDDEFCIVFTREEDGKGAVWCNGIKLIDVTSDYYNTIEDTTQDVYFDIGSYHNTDTSSYSPKMQVYEVAIFNTTISDIDIKRISNVANYHLRYEFETNTIAWHRTPYTDHFEDGFKTSIEEVYKVNDDANLGLDVETYRAGYSKGRGYASTFKSLKLATYIPDNSYVESIEWNELTETPIQGYPFTYMLNTKSRNYIMDNFIVRHDSNRFSYNTDYNFLSGIVDMRQKYEVASTSFDTTFMYFDRSGSYDRHISLTLGTFLNNLNTHINTGNYYSFIARLIRKANSTREELRVYVYNSGTKEATSTPIVLPYKLLGENIYTLSRVSKGTTGHYSIVLSSSTDTNYANGVELFNDTMAAYEAKDYGSMLPSFDIYQEGGYRVADGPYNELAIGTVDGVDETFSVISTNAYDDSEAIVKAPGFMEEARFRLRVPANALRKIDFIDILGTMNEEFTKVLFYVSFNDTEWKYYDSSTKEWTTTSIDTLDNAMTIEDIVGITEYQFDNTGGFTDDSLIDVMVILTTEDVTLTPKIDKVSLAYNGPITIDSWIDNGTFNDDNKQFYYSNEYSPYLEADFSSDDQGWEEMGTDTPSSTVFTGSNGSRPSSGTVKYYGGVSVHLMPKGKYYWRVAAYNGE